MTKTIQKIEQIRTEAQRIFYNEQRRKKRAAEKKVKSDWYIKTKKKEKK